MQKRKQKEKREKVRKETLFFMIIITLTLFLGIGYSKASDIDLIVEGEATANSPKDIVITNIEYLSSINANHTLSTINEPYLTIMNSKIVLENDLSSEITFKIKVKNNTEISATYIEAIYDTEIGYDNTDIQFFLNGISSGNILGAKEEKEFTITFKYREALSEITNNTLNSYINFKFNLQNKVAKIDNTYFNSLKDAIRAVSQNNIETKIDLLQDTTEVLEINQDKNIVIDLQEHILNNYQNNPIIKNNGHLIIKNGTLKTTATQGAINNEVTGNLKLEKITIKATGTRQALYNNGGTAIITGNSKLTSTTSQRATIQNINNGVLIIEDASVTSFGFNAIVNEGIMRIGTKDDNPNKTVPTIQGEKYGINSTTNYSFYNGSIKGTENATNNDSYIEEIEENYNIASTEEIIGQNKYKVIFLAETYTITFDATGGNIIENTRNVAKGEKICTLPLPTKQGYAFAGWFTSQNDGNQITENTVINEDATYYAHWIKEKVAEMNGNEYSTIQEALNNILNTTPTTINILKDTRENIVIQPNQNIILNLQTYTLKNKTDNQVINNKGTLIITNGTISSNASKATIDNNESSQLIIENVTITATGTRQAIYNKASGYVEIKENAIVMSSATGTPDTSTLSRATIQNLAGGTIVITGGTIIGNNQQAISNEGLLTIGTKDGNISNDIPIIQGETYGIVSNGVVNFYDGTIRGIVDAISGNITDLETSIINDVITINNKTYKTLYNNY